MSEDLRHYNFNILARKFNVQYDKSQQYFGAKIQSTSQLNRTSFCQTNIYVLVQSIEPQNSWFRSSTSWRAAGFFRRSLTTFHGVL